MRFPRLTALLPFAFSMFILSAQVSTPAWPNEAPSFTTISGLNTLWIAPIPNAPFSATVSLQGYDRQSYATVARDSAGRVFEELRSLVPPNGRCDEGCGDGGEPGPEPWVTDRIYIDPTHNTAFDCVANRHRLCFTLPYARMAGSTQQFHADPKLGASFRPMGTRRIDGIQATGVRQSFRAFQSASPGPPPIHRTANISTRQIWYSPDLQMDLLVKNSFDRTLQSLQVKTLKRSEPAAKLFSTPANYKLTSDPLPTPTSTTDQVHLNQIRQAIIDRLTQNNAH